MEQQLNYFVLERRPKDNISNSDWWFNKTFEKIVQRSLPNIIAVVKLKIRLTTMYKARRRVQGFERKTRRKEPTWKT